MVALPGDLAAAVARAGVDPTAESRPLVAALRSAIADRRGYVSRDLDEICLRMNLLRPVHESLRGGTLAEALAWCLVWLMAGDCRGAAFD